MEMQQCPIKKTIKKKIVKKNLQTTDSKTRKDQHIR